LPNITKLIQQRNIGKPRCSKNFEKNYEVKKTEREAVEISLYDTDPKIASAIVNAVVEK
jgi:hypothetical protein